MKQFTLDELKSFNDDITNLTNLITINEYVFVARIIKALELAIFEYEKYVKRKCEMDFNRRHHIYSVEHYLKNDCYRVKIKNLKTIKSKFIYIQNNLSKRHCDNTVLDIFDNENKDLIICEHLSYFTNDIVSICNSISKNDINFINRLKIVINKKIVATISKYNRIPLKDFLNIYYSNNLIDLYCLCDSMEIMLNNLKFLLYELDNIKFDVRELIDNEEKISKMSF